MCLVRGYAMMAVREARRGRDRLREGDTASALNRLAWAWRYLTLAERAIGLNDTEGTWRALERASGAVEAVRAQFVATWPRDHHAHAA